jgi:hypothetical protein
VEYQEVSLIPNKRYLSPELNIIKLYQMYKEKCIEDNSEPVSEYRYRYIFNHELNFSLGRPFQGTCKECYRLDMQIKSTGGEEGKKNLEVELNLHQREAEAAYEALKQDGAWSRQDPSTVVVCFDLQQALPTPIIHTSFGLYKRQLWCYNSDVHNMAADQASMFL